MIRTFLGAKLHRAVVTETNVDYEGSLAIDQDLMDTVGIAPFEKILVGNQANGNRFETYAIAAARGSRTIQLNGAAALLGQVGQRLTIMTFVQLHESEWAHHVPKVLVLDAENRIVERKGF